MCTQLFIIIVSPAFKCCDQVDWRYCISEINKRKCVIASTAIAINAEVIHYFTLPTSLDNGSFFSLIHWSWLFSFQFSNITNIFLSSLIQNSGCSATITSENILNSPYFAFVLVLTYQSWQNVIPNTIFTTIHLLHHKCSNLSCSLPLNKRRPQLAVSFWTLEDGSCI